MTEREEEFLREQFGNEEEFRAASDRVNAGEPLAYVLGHWYFWRQEYRVTPDVLIPRPDTELLVEKIIKILPNGGKMLDLCTGSGCVAISSVGEVKSIRADALEISPAAVAVAAWNAAANGLGKEISFYCADALSGETPELLRAVCAEAEPYDLIVSNPPYIKTDVIEGLSDQVRHEPRLALDGGGDGMRFYRGFLSLYPGLLRRGGALLFEIGYDQAEQIKSEAERAGAAHCKIYKDYGGNDRVAEIVF